MKILVTGAAGFLGQRIVHALVQASHQVLAVVRDETVLPPELCSPVVTVLRTDLRQTAFSRSLHSGVDAVVSLAQWAKFRNFPEEAESVFRVNVQANVELLEWARRTSVQKFVLVSSGGARTIQERRADDSPIEFYLTTKLCAELLFRCYRKCFQMATLLRPYFIYGAGQHEVMLIPRLIARVRTGKPISLQGPDGLRLNPVHVDDVARAVAGSLQLRGFHEHDIGGPDTLTLRRIVEMMGHALRRKPLFEQVAGTPQDLIAEGTDLCVALGLPRTGFERGLALTLGQLERNGFEY